MSDKNKKKAYDTFINVMTNVLEVPLSEETYLNFSVDTFPTSKIDEKNVAAVKGVLAHLDGSIVAYAADAIDRCIGVLKGIPRRNIYVPTSAPSITYNYEVYKAKVPPTLIDTRMWNGTLYLGSISAAISKDWTSWAGVTHIVCVLGRFAGQEEAT